MHDDDILTPPLADTVERLKNDRPDPEALAAAADRVWQRLESTAAETPAAEAPIAASGAADRGTTPITEIGGCDDFQALIPTYLAGELSAERKLLLEDHSRECLPCRRALTAARTGQAASAESARPRTAPPARSRWLAIAAVLVAVVGLAGYLAFAPGGLTGGEVAVVESADGPLLHVGTDGDVVPLAPGDPIAAGDRVRTAHGGGAVVRLADGSAVELAGGTELSARPRFASTTVRLERGNIIVEAAERDRGHLYVATDECRVAVTGTIFSVNHGVQGSRVSVIEGEVRVARASAEESVLHPGMQVTTRASLTPVPVAEEVAWSQQHDRYAALLRELTALSRALDEEVERPGLRTSSRLLDGVPAETIGYLAVPNLSEQIVQSWNVFRRQLSSSPALVDWWRQNAAEDEDEIDRAIVALSDFGAYLGDELTVAIVHDSGGGESFDGGPIVSAEIVRAGFAAFLEQEAARINAEAGDEALVVVDDPYAAPEVDGLLLWAGAELFLAAPSPELLALGADAAGGRAATLGGELYDRIDRAYSGGVEWLFAADLNRLHDDAHGHGHTRPTEAGDELDRLGWGSAGTLLVEHRSGDGAAGRRAETAVDLSFPEGRTGLVSWIGEPAAIGALDYVSPDATAAAAVLLREPAEIFDELLALGGAEAMLRLAEAQTATGLDFRNDLAASLGSEMAVALDGPLVPEPSWKVVVEVHDPDRLQSAIERLVERAITSGEAPGLTLETGELEGRPAYRLADGSTAGDAFEVHYLYRGGYLIAAPSRALLGSSLGQQTSGTSLTASAAFRDLLPSGEHASASGIFYQNLGPTVAPLLGGLSELSIGELDPAHTSALATLAEESEPTLALLYAEPDRVRVAATTPGGVLGFGYRTLLGLGGLSELVDASVQSN